MKSKILSVILAVITVLSVIPVISVSAAEAAESGRCGDDAYYVLYDDGKLIISGTGVTDVDFFSSREDIKKLTVKKGIVRINDGLMFSCNNLEKVSIADSVLNIGIYAFSDCVLLKEVRLPSELKVVNEGLFAGDSSLTKIELPDSIVRIDDYAFDDCSSLKNIRLSSSLKYIGNDVFSGCTALKYVTVLNPECEIAPDILIPQTAKIYGYADSTAETYAGDNGNEFIAIEDGKVYPELTEAEELTAASHGNIEYYECAVTGKTFSDAEGLNEISKESTVIHDEVGVVMPTVPATCTAEGHEGGRMCSICGKELEAPTVIPIDENAHTPGKTLMENYTAPTCTEEGHYDAVVLCRDCGKELERGENKIIIPKAPHTVKNWEITEESTDTENGTRTGTCSVCGEKVTETLPLLKDAGSCGDTASYKFYEDGHLVISGTGYVDVCYFLGNSDIKKVTVEDGITGLGEGCLSNCPALEEVYIADSVTDIEDGAFYNCKYLEKIKLPSELEKINMDTFSECIFLEEIDLPESLISIGKSAFENCYSLKEINIPSKVEEINSMAFCSCISLEKIELPDSVNHIDDFAFADCASLRYVTVPDAECYIANDPDTIPVQVKIYGYKNSTAEAYAEYYRRTFIEIKENEVYPEPVEAVPATDKADGNIAYYKCPVTGKLFSDAEGKNEITVEDTVVHNDNIILAGKAPTCTENGLTEGRMCSVCGKVTVPQEVIKATGHTWDEGKITKEPTCVDKGERTYTCTVCKATRTEEVEATGHTDNNGDGICDKCNEKIPGAAAIGDVDLDGKISASDARLALRISVSLENNLTEAQLSAADVDGEKGVTASDARLILRVSVNLEEFKIA